MTTDMDVEIMLLKVVTGILKNTPEKSMVNENYKLIWLSQEFNS